MKEKPYCKHVYWMTPEEEQALGKSLASEHIKLKRAKGIVCTPLDVLNKISSVAPEVWNDTCRRQGSWYRASERNGLYLIVSSFDLKAFRPQKAAVITVSDFRPPKRASLAEKKRLFRNPRLLKRMPQAWSQVRDMEKRIYLRWARRFGSHTDDYDFLFLSHTANHANFISPRFFIREGNGLVPYSIERTAHLCSCCIELFQVLGSEFPKKLVAPCPGASIFARLRPDQYLSVESC
jgi:hypothetical protein